VVSANTAGVFGTALPPASGDGGSQIVDFRGNVVAQALQGPSMAANVDLDLEGLRASRRRVGMENMLARQRFELYAPTYAKYTLYPANTVDGVPAREDFRRAQQSVIDRLAADGVI